MIEQVDPEVRFSHRHTEATTTCNVTDSENDLSRFSTARGIKEKAHQKGQEGKGQIWKPNTWHAIMYKWERYHECGGPP